MFNSKKKFFKEKIKENMQAIWVWEFKLFIARELREERRKQRDRAVESIGNLEVKLQNKELSEDEKKLIELQKQEQEMYKLSVEDDIIVMDIKINGADFNKLPEDKKEKYTQRIANEEWLGMIPTIESMRERLKMYAAYIRNL